MINRFGKILLFFAIVLACSKDEPVPITGTIAGNVTEENSTNAIAGASVSLAGEVNQATSTGSSGSFSFANIVAGSYQVTVSKSGYVTQTKNITLQAEKTASANFSLLKNIPNVNPNQLELTTEDNSKTIELENTRSAVMNFTTQTSKDWLTVSPSTGSINQGNKLIITVTADLENVPYNTYTETLIINVGEASVSIPITVVHTEPPYITITSPKKDDVYKMGSIMSIRWDSNLDGKVKIDLIRASQVKAEVSTETENKNGGNFSWEIPALEEEYYTLRITSKENENISNETEPFKINEGPTVPIVETGEAIESGINFLKVGGEIISLGIQADQVDQYGHVYSISNETPTVGDARTKYGISKEAKTYQSNITSLQSAETYYVRAYATNGKGTSYGEIITMTTTSGGPVITTNDASDITQNSAKVGGNISSDGGSTITERGVFYGLTEEVNSDSDAVKDSSTEVGSFTISLTGLEKGTVYYFMAYAKNSSGYGYGEVKQLNTVGDPPTVKTTQVDKVSGKQAEVTGEIESTGGEPLSSYGFAYSKNTSPTVDDTKIEVGQDGSGEFKATLTDLDVTTKYYVRAYATNPRGTSYGEELSFTTLDGKPGVTTLGYEDVTGNSVLVNGRIDDDGGEDLTSYGFAYAETSDPTIDGFKLEVGKDGDGNYQGQLTGLKTETKYYIRAYATNTNGTSYGEEIEITTTNGIPVVNTVGSRDIEADKAVMTGTIKSNGGTELSSYGFVYSKNENPTINDTKLEVGQNTTGGFSGTASNLTRLTTYYFKAFATNSNGTSYGEQLSFKTIDGPYLVITAPTLNQNISVGSTFNITWDTNKTDDYLTIEHWIGNSKTELSNNTPIGANSFAWNIPEDTQKGSDNIIRLIENNGSESHDSPKFILSDLTYVPDDNFEQTLIDNGWDDKLDDYVVTSNISGVQDLTISGVADVTGIEDFIGLKKLTVASSDKRVTTKVVDLSKLIVLEELLFDVYGISSLESFILPDSSALESAIIGKESGSSEELSSALDPVDFSKATGLKTLRLSAFSGITTLDFSNNLELESYTGLNHHKLNSVNISKNTKLTNFEINGFFDGNRSTISSIDFSNNTALDRIYIRYTGLENVDISMLGNDITNVLLPNNDDLRCIKLSQSQYNNLSSNANNWQKPSTASWSTSCEEVYIPDDNFEKELISLGYDFKLDNYVLKSNIINITVLDVRDKDISSLEGIASFENLITLRAGRNNITTLDVSALSKLNNLELQGSSELSSITLPNSDNLDTVDINATKITSIDVSGLPNLKLLDLNNNPITELDVVQNPKIQKLYIDGTEIETIDLSKNIYLSDSGYNNNSGFVFHFTTVQGESGLSCVRVPKAFMKSHSNKANPYGWQNKDNSPYDIARILCYEVIIDRSNFMEGSSSTGKYAKQFLVDSQNRLYVIWQNGTIMRYSSSGDDETLVGGGNGYGEAYNQFISDNVYGDFRLDANEENFIIMDGGRSTNSNGTPSGTKFRFLKWPVGGNTGYLMAEWNDELFDGKRDQSIGYSNFVYDNNQDIYFSSKKMIFKLKSGTSTIEMVMANPGSTTTATCGGLPCDMFGRSLIFYDGKMYNTLSRQNAYRTVSIDPTTGYQMSEILNWGAKSYDLSKIDGNFVFYSQTGNNLYVEFLSGTWALIHVNGHNHMNSSGFYTDVKWPSIVGGGNNKVLMDSDNYVYILDEFSYRILKSTTPLKID